MSRAMYIHFDANPRVDKVTLALVPTDGLSGAIVRSGVRAAVKGLPDRPVLNASGMLVFINLPDQPAYEVEVDARDAGFSGPQSITFVPPAAGTTEPAMARRCVVLLKPRPDYPFPDSATMVRGVAVRGAAKVAGARVAILLPPSQRDLSVFEAMSAENGAFAIAARLPDFGVDEKERPVPVLVRLIEGDDERALPCELTSGRSHSFLDPIDLVGSNEPGFFTA